MRIENFNVISSFEGEDVSIVSSIVLPDLWSFEERAIFDEYGEILEYKQYVISDFRQTLELRITPKSINKLRNIKSSVTTEVVVTNETEKQYIADYSIPDSDKFQSLSIYREDINENEMRYFQRVESIANPEEGPTFLEEFIVFNRNKGFVDEESFVYIADITLHFKESVTKDNKDELLEMVNEVVSSLQIKN